MQKADEDAATAEEEGEEMKVLPLTRYKQYLQRCKKLQYIQERMENISDKLGAELRGLSPLEPVEILHTSTADYMTWIKSEKIPFDRQPALSPEETGVPTIRRFLFNLPASQNLRLYTHHINDVVPAFVEKLNRVVTQSDRDAGFRTIADEFDSLYNKFLGDMLKQVHWVRECYSKASVDKMKKDTAAYKKALKERIEKRWLTLRSPAFTRILKSRGTVPEGTSKAKGLEKTVNWNLEIANIMRPGFQKWHAMHTERLQNLKAAIPLQLDRLYLGTSALMNNSAANLITVEKAKIKWKPYRQLMKSKILAMMEELLVEEKKLLNRATLADERENNLITFLTDSIYDDVFASTPELKPTAPGKPKRYVTPILRFRKDRLEKHFLTTDDHFIDELVNTFQDQLDEKMTSLVDKHFIKLNVMFDGFSKLLREHAPIDYEVSPMGVHMREQLEKQISYIEGKSKTLRTLLPASIKDEDEAGGSLDDCVDDAGDQVHDLEYFLNQIAMQKRKRGETLGSASKRVKQETF